MKMNKVFFTLIIGIIAGIFLFGNISAEDGGIGKVCIDLDSPTWSENVTFTLNFIDGNMHLSWTPAEDEPECSGISHYDIYRGFNGGNLSFIENSTVTSFLDDITVQPGTYTYMIHATDKVGHLESIGISALINIPAPPTPAGPGGGGASMLSFWECEEWSVCSADGFQERTCIDINEVEPDIIEIRTCIQDFTSTATDNGEETEETETTEEKSQNLFGRTTGAMIGALGIGGTVVAVVFVGLIVVLGSIAIAVRATRGTFRK